MQLDAMLNSFYAVGSLWSALTGPGICSVSLSPMSRPAHEVARAPVPGAWAAVIAFVDVNVVPMDTERVLPNHTVLVAGGRITALGPTGKVQVPAEAVRIDGRGKYLMPGLGTMHGHEIYFTHEGAPRKISDVKGVSSGDLMSYKLAEGVTAVGNESGPVDSLLPQLRRALQTIPGPRLYFSGRRIQGEGDFDPLAGAPQAMHNHSPPFEAVLALGAGGGSAEHIYAIYWDIPPVLRTYARYWDSLAITPQQRDSAAMLKQQIQTRAAAIQRAGVWITPTLACATAHGVFPFSKLLFQLQVTKVLHEAGVKLLLATDDAWDAHDDLRAFVNAGLSPYQALVTGTRHIAQYFGRLDSSGTVAVGKWADLVLLAGNPLTDVGNAREPAGVMRAGRWFDRAALDRLTTPYSWLAYTLRFRGYLEDFRPGGRAGTEQRAKLQALWDSLAVVKPQGRAAYEPVLTRFAAELGVLYATLTPEQQRDWLGPPVRVWLREQARQGYRVTVPGVPLTP